MGRKRVAPPKSDLDRALDQQAMALDVFEQARNRLSNSNDLLDAHDARAAAEQERLAAERINIAQALERNNRAYEKVSEILGA